MPDEGHQKSTAWTPLHYSIFRALWIAATVSNVGTWMQNVAGVWMMTSLSHSPVMVSLMQTATSLPVFLVVLPAGAIADIIDRRRMLLFTQAWMTVAAAGLAVVTFMGATTPWMLLSFTFALGVGAAMNMPIWQTVVPRLVPRKELPQAVALNSVAFNIARAVGPALGGLIVALSGPGLVFLLNAISFIGVIAIVYRWDSSRRENQLPAEHIISAIRVGTRYMTHAPELRSALIRCCIFVTFGSALWALMPLVARHELGMNARGYGILVGFFGTGALSGAMTLPKMRKRMSMDTLLTIATLIFAFVTFALAYLRIHALLYLTMIAGGVAWVTVMSSLNVAAQTSAASWVQSRALGFFTLAFQGLMGVSSVLWGAIAEFSGNSFSLLFAGIGLVCGLFGAFVWPLKGLKNLDLRPSQHWSEPLAAITLDPDDGPVLIMLDYRIDVEKAVEFNSAMHELKRVRHRDGARRWGLYNDITDPGRYVETFIVPSWAEHVRQHARFTIGDREIEDRVRSFHVGPEAPVVSHFIYVK
ncbi:MAG: MFS transporter [Deltaproteobacteria bacterium]|nr:MFS transporter [Deltaproteobacteria bacterium]